MKPLQSALEPGSAIGARCSEAGILDRFWLEFSAVIPWLGGAESDEGIEIFGRPEEADAVFANPIQLLAGGLVIAADPLFTAQLDATSALRVLYRRISHFRRSR